MKDGPALSEFQEWLTDPGASAFRRYQALVVGSPRLRDLVAYELAVTFLLPLPGALGYLLRQKLLPFLLGAVGRGTMVGRGLTVRHPGKIRLGSNVALDDFVTLDAKGTGGGIEIGDRVMISRGTVLVAMSGAMVIGDGCNIGAGCRIATRDHLRLGRSVLIAANCYLGGYNHRFERTDMPVIQQGLRPTDGVDIGDNVWLGAGVTVLNGVRIGRDAIVGAHSLVLQDVPEMAIVAGSPARVIRTRTPGEKEDS